MDLLVLAVTLIINFTLGLFVIVRESKRLFARSFGIMCIFIMLWIAANYLTNHSIDNTALANVANRVAFVSGFGLLASGLVFTYVFPVQRHIGVKEKGLVGLSTTLIAILSSTQLIAGTVDISTEGLLLFQEGVLWWLYVVAFLGFLALIARNLLSVSNSERVKFHQSRIVLFAFSTSATLGLLLNVIIPALSSNWEITRFGPLVTIILVGCITYAIVKHGLFDIRLAAVRGVAYVFSLLTLAAVYYVTAFGISQAFIQDQAAVAAVQSPVSVALALILAFVFQPVKKFFDRLTNNIFFHDNYDTDDFLARLGEELSTASDLRDLLKRASNEIGGTLQAEHAYFFVRYGQRHVNSGTAHHPTLEMAEIRKLDEYIAQFGSKAAVTDLISDAPETYALLKRHKVAIVLPLMYNRRALSYLLIGRRRSREYAQRDVRVLDTIANELVIAIQNALSVQEVKDINATLQQRVNDATKELRATNKQLQRLDAAKDEFISMASHQLRTPLTSVKGYISMVLEGDAGRISASQREVLEEAFASSERMVHLIGDFLNVSRLKTGKFMVDRRPSDLVKLITQEVASMQSTIKAHNMQLTFKKPPYFPILYIDEAKVRQVIMNFIDNAMYYSREGTEIKVALEIIDGSAVLTVRDTGIGVPQSEQSHLFSKFFRASNARRRRPDGTGVGLFLAKKVVTAHGGSIVFESTEGEGSTFGFRLPIKRLSQTPTEDSDQLDDQPDDDNGNTDAN